MEFIGVIQVEPEEVPHVMDDHEIALLVLQEALKINSENGVAVTKFPYNKEI